MPPSAPLPRASLARIPRQQRSIEMVHAILDAAILLLERDGVQAFTTNRVAELAGCSVGSLYQYFSNKEMLIAGIVERGILDVEQLVRDAVGHAGSVPPSAIVRQLLLALLIRLDPYRDLLAEILAATPVLTDRGIAAVLETRLSDAMRDFLVANADRYMLLGGPPMLYAIVNGAIYVALKWLSERPTFVTREQLVDAMVAQLSSVLQERA